VGAGQAGALLTVLPSSYDDGAMNEREIELFNDSLERCTRASGFLDRFYELFLASSEEVAKKFKHTDFRKQKRALKPEFYELWLDCLIRAVKEFDRLCDSETERAWRSMMRAGIEFMKSRYSSVVEVEQDGKSLEHE